MDRRSFVKGLAGAGVLAALPTAAEASTGVTGGRVPKPVFTNMADTASRRRVAALLHDAGVSPWRVTAFLAHVEQYVDTVPRSALTRGFVPLLGHKTLYDPYALQDVWNAKHPNFVGYNCRITAFSLFGDRFRLRRIRSMNSKALFLDLEALASDPSALPRTPDVYRFRQMYATVPTVSSLDPLTHAAVLRRDWSRRGIGFVDSSKARLISVLQHNKIDRDELFIGHTGVLLPSHGALWFVEKLAFQLPYQLTRFADRRQLNDYLMGLYDDDGTGTTAPPVILENDRVMPGYRVLHRR